MIRSPFISNSAVGNHHKRRVHLIADHPCGAVADRVAATAGDQLLRDQHRKGSTNRPADRPMAKPSCSITSSEV